MQRAVGLGLMQWQLFGILLCDSPPFPARPGLRGIDVVAEESDMEGEEEPARQTLPLCRGFSEMDTRVPPRGSCGLRCLALALGCTWAPALPPLPRGLAEVALQLT